MAERKIIDIHSHLLFGVDDGAATINDSIAMLDIAKSQDVKVICLTPHYRKGMFKYSKEAIDENFEALLPEAEARGITLLKGCEYHVNTDITDNFDSGLCYTMNSTGYVLAEFKYEAEEHYIFEQCKHLLRHGYTPIVAHVERYIAMYRNPSLADDLKRQGSIIQVNADAILGLDGFRSKMLVKRLIKAGVVDVVGSDSHDTKERACHLEKCFDYVEKKYGIDTANKLFYKKAASILGIED